MKSIKLFLLLFLFVSASLINNYEYTKKSKNVLFLNKKENSKSSSSHKSNSMTNRSHYSKSNNHSKKSLSLLKSRTKSITAILLGVNIALKISNAVMVKMIHSKLTDNLKYLDKEKAANTKTIKALRDIEIDGCSQIKLIMEINKRFFVLSQFQTILITTYQHVKENIFHFKEDGSNFIFKIDNNELLRQKIEIRDKIVSMSNLVSHSFKEIESNLCGDNLRTITFLERNKEIDKQVKLIKAEISKVSGGFLQQLFNKGFSAIINVILAPTKIFGSKESFNEEMENAKNSSDSLDEDSLKNFSDSVKDYKPDKKEEKESIKEVLDLEEALKAHKVKLLDKTFNILGKILVYVSLIMNILMKLKLLPGSDVIKYIINALNLVGKICKTIAAYIKYKVSKKDNNPNKNIYRAEFWKALINLEKEIIKLAFEPLAGIFSEVSKLIKNFYLYSDAKKRLAQQINSYNHFVNLGEIEVREAENFKNFNVCRANHINKESIYSFLADFSSTIKDLSKDVVDSDENHIKNIYNYLFHEEVVSSPFYKDIILIIKKEVMLICEKNLNFCARTLNKKFLNEIGFSEKEIGSLVYKTIYGPYTDLVAVSSQDIKASFILLGYEPAGENLLGCRMCDDKKVIRYTEILSEVNDKERMKRRSNGLLGDKKMYEAFDKSNSYNSEVRNFRLDQENFLYYEVIDFENKNLGLQKFTYYQIRDSSLRMTKVYNQIITASYEYYGLLGRWDKEKGVWDNIDVLDGDDVKKSFHHLTTGNPIIIKNGESLSIRSVNIKELKNSLPNQILDLMPVYGNAGILGNDEFQEKNIDKYIYFDAVYFSSRPDKNQETYGSFRFRNKNLCSNVENCQQIKTTECTFKFEAFKDESVIPLKENHYNWIILEDSNNQILSKKLIESLKANVRKDIFDKSYIGCVSGFEKTVQEKEMTEKIKSIKKFALVQFAPFDGFDENLLNTTPEFSCEQECGNEILDNEITCPYKSDASWFRFDNNNNDDENVNLADSLLYSTLKDKKFKDRGISDDPFLVLNSDYIKIENKIIKSDLEFKFKKNSKSNKMNIIIQAHHLDMGFSDNHTQREKENIRKNSFLYISKKDKNLELKISSKKSDDEIDEAFKIKLSHMGSLMFLIKFEDTRENFKFIKRLLRILKGYYIIESAVLKSDEIRSFLITTKTYIIAVIQPFSNFGFLPFNNEFGDKKCEKMFYDELINQSECEKNSLLCKKFDLSKDADELYHQVKGHKEFANAFNINLTKLYSIRYEKTDPLKQISLSDLFITSKIHNYFADCDKLEFYLPIYSAKNINGQYRKLIAEHSNSVFKNIKEVMVANGPQVKNVYWIRLGSSKNVQNFYDSINYYGYTTLMSEDTKINSEIDSKSKKEEKNLFANVILSHDYRLREDTTNLCKYCSIVRENLFNKNR